MTTLNPRDGFAYQKDDNSAGTCRVYEEITGAENQDKFFAFQLENLEYIDYVHVMGAAWEGGTDPDL